MPSFFDKMLWGNTVLSYLLVGGGIVLTWVIIRLIKKYILAGISHLSGQKGKPHHDILLNAARKFIIPYIFLFVNYTLIKQLNLSAKADKILDGAMAFVTMYYVVRLINYSLRLLIGRYLHRRGETEERIAQLNGMMIVVSVLIWIIGLLTLANNFGYNISTILASLGVGGIAIALASQAILGDLFSYLVIFFDKPFEVGDFVVLDDNMGSIEYIGIKTTRLRSLSGEQLILSNTKMTNSAIHNYKRMEKRRVVFKLAVLYDTDFSQLQSIPQMLRNIILAQKDIQLDRVHLSEYGANGINFEAVYYMLSADYNKYMDTQQVILLAIHEEFLKKGVKFASPVQNFYLNAPATQSSYANGAAKPAAQTENNQKNN
jgi:small-conductance mechanosensitive channel